MRVFLAIGMIVTSLWVLERARKDVSIVPFTVGQTPVAEYSMSGADGPIVVVAHGFAGSQQMMQGYALPLARAGYRVFAFEFLGHGRHPAPMSGDVTTIDGTTRLLVDQTHAVIDAVATGDLPVALVGHSMATDILVRAAATRTDIGPMVLISAFSRQIDAETPQNLLLVTGAWEPGLRDFARRAVQMVAPGASEETTVTQGAITRRAIAAPLSEHVSVLQSRVGRAEAIAWLDQGYGRGSVVTILPSGWAILGLLCGLVLIFRTIAQLLPLRSWPPVALTLRQYCITLIAPTLVTPFVAVPLNYGFLPVLVADYLVLHLFVFGALQLILLRFWRASAGPFSWIAFCGVLLWCALFGAALNRYAANFWPTPGRFWIVLVMMIGAVVYMVSDTLLSARTTRLRRLSLRASFLISLGIAVALDFDGLFFLIMIAPVLVLFYLIFGTMGRQAAIRSGPLSPGLALGVVLAWALGVSFPLFQS